MKQRVECDGKYVVHKSFFNKHIEDVKIYMKYFFSNFDLQVAIDNRNKVF